MYWILDTGYWILDTGYRGRFLVIAIILYFILLIFNNRFSTSVENNRILIGPVKQFISYFFPEFISIFSYENHHPR